MASYLLLQDGSKLLLQDGGGILLGDGTTPTPAAQQVGSGAKWEFGERVLDDDEAFVLILALA